MQRTIDETPSWVSAILDWRLVSVAARIALTSAYLLGGLTKLFNFAGAVAEQESFGLRPGWLWASLAIGVELIGSVLVISGRFVWLGAGALGVLTAIATLVANNFWTMQGQARFAATNTFFEHVGLIAAFVLVAALTEAQHKEGRR